MSEREEKQARNERMRAEMDAPLESFEQQRAQLGELQARLAATTVSAWSADNMVRIDSNVAGIPVDVHIDARAFKRSTPDKLARSVLEAVHAAARQAGDATQQAVAPLEAEVGAMPDLSELIPGAPASGTWCRAPLPPPATPCRPRRNDHRHKALFPGIGNHPTAQGRTVITLGFAIAIGLPLAVLILSVTLSERRHKP